MVRVHAEKGTTRIPTTRQILLMVFKLLDNILILMLITYIIALILLRTLNLEYPFLFFVIGGQIKSCKPVVTSCWTYSERPYHEKATNAHSLFASQCEVKRTRTAVYMHINNGNSIKAWIVCENSNTFPVVAINIFLFRVSKKCILGKWKFVPRQVRKSWFLILIEKSVYISKVQPYFSSLYLSYCT